MVLIGFLFKDILFQRQAVIYHYSKSSDFGRIAWPWPRRVRGVRGRVRGVRGRVRGVAWPCQFLYFLYVVLVRSSVVKAVATDLNTYVVCSNPVPCFYFSELHCTHHSARMVSANDKLWIWLKV